MSLPTIAVKDLHDDVELLDVREQNEWDAGHAIEAVHIPLGQLPARASELPDPGEGPLYVVCRSGKRSAQAVEHLRGLGYDAINVEGGMQGWQSAGKQMLSDNGADPTII